MNNDCGLPFKVVSASLHKITVNDDFTFEITYNVVTNKGACYQVTYHNVKILAPNALQELPKCNEENEFYTGTYLIHPCGNRYYFNTLIGTSRDCEAICLQKPDPIEVTMKDLEEKYGRPVKIVGEDKDNV